MKTYLDRYFDAFGMLKSVTAEARSVKGIDFEGEKSFSRDLQQGEFRKAFDEKAIPMIKGFAELYLRHRSMPTAHNCHAVSHGFLKSWESIPISRCIPMAITIGNVWFRNQNIYNATTQTVLDLLSEGPVARKKLPVHVWLTLGDMTVFDLTILASLPQLGFQTSDQSSVLVWREESISEFSYEPLLVHNGFFDLVDTGRTELLVAPKA